MARNNAVRIDKFVVEASEKDLVDSAGLGIGMRFIECLGFFRLCDQRLPVSDSNSGYSPSVYMKTLFALCLLHPDSAAPLERIDDFRKSRAVRRMLGLKEIPTAKSVGDWLRRMAYSEILGRREDGSCIVGGYRHGLSGMQNLHYETATTALKRTRSAQPSLLDFDACAIHGEKKCDRKMYDGERGTMSYLAFVEDICLMAELESGNHSPSDNISQRVASCLAICEVAGIPILQFRSDAAAFESKVINHCCEKGITFYIRADNDSAVSEACANIDDWGYWEVRSSKSNAFHELGTAAHCMNKTYEAFMLVAKRVRIPNVGGDNSPQLPLSNLEPSYRYFSVATNAMVTTEPSDGSGYATPNQIVETYNKRGNCENRIKQLVSDTQAGRLPTGDLGANRIYFYIMACLHNLLVLFKNECFDAQYRNLRLPGLIRLFLKIPARVAFHSRALMIRLPVYMKRLTNVYQKILNKISSQRRLFHKGRRAVSFHELVFRRD